MAWICGVEEAGRGPVLGPMVMACCWVDARDEKLLREIGCKDSKLLTPQQREGAFERLKELKKRGKVGFELIILSPAEIDAAVEGVGDNLNKLELRTSAQLINKALKSKHGAKLTKALIDCPTKNTTKYANDIKALLSKKIEVVAEHKADVKYPVVSAASIIAKVTRDAEIAKLQQRCKVALGSGYPADPATQQFLRENYRKGEYAKLFRKSWQTYKNVVEAGKQRSLDNWSGQAGEQSARAAKKELSFLQQHGFSFEAPKGAYEVVRMKGPGAVIIKYTTGKLVIQGKEKAKVERLLRTKTFK